MKYELKEYRKKGKTIERKLKDNTSRAEAKLLLHTLIYHFDGFAPQQQLVSKHMAFNYHWGNKRTASALKILSEIGIIDHSRSGPDNWTLLILVRGFLHRCYDRIQRAKFAIKKRMNYFRNAIFSPNLMRAKSAGP